MKDDVFHVGGNAGILGPATIIYATNVLGTHNVLKAFAENGVRYPIYASTAGVIFAGKDLFKHFLIGSGISPMNRQLIYLASIFDSRGC